MTKDILTNKDFIKLKEAHTRQILDIAHKHTDEITVVARHEFVEYDPPIDKKNLQISNRQIRFTLMNYTLSSMQLPPDNLVFEAGFGAKNDGHIVSIPYKAISQISTRDQILHLNVSTLFLKKEVKLSSKDIFKQNKTNKKFFKEEKNDTDK